MKYVYAWMVFLSALILSLTGCGAGKGLEPATQGSSNERPLPLAVRISANGASGSYVLLSSTTPVTLAWSSTGAESCFMAEGANILVSSLSGTYPLAVGALTVSKTFTASCRDSAGNVVSSQVAVTVPSVFISANGSVNALSVNANTNVAIAWGSSGVDSCSLSSSNPQTPFSASGKFGTQQISSAAFSTLITIDCLVGAQHIIDDVQITIAAPIVNLSLTANGTPGIYTKALFNEPVTLAWSASGVDNGSCVVNPGALVGNTGSFLIPNGAPQTTATFTLSCMAAGAPVSAAVLVAVVPDAFITANGVLGTYTKGTGGTSQVTIAWNSAGMGNCTVSPLNITASAGSFVVSNAAITATTDFTLTCDIGLPRNVRVVVPTVSITANGSSGTIIKDTSDIAIAWTSSGTTNCDVSPIGANLGANGSRLIVNSSLIQSTTYTVSCAKDGAPIGSAPLTASVKVTVFGNAISVFNPSSSPGNFDNDPDVGTGGGLELGAKFRSAVAGRITGIRFYRASGAVGPFRGTLWTKGGVNLGSVAFTTTTSSGWQQAMFSAPILIKANTTYVASYFYKSGPFAKSFTDMDSGQCFSGRSFSNGPLRALADGDDGANGVFAYGNGSVVAKFPSDDDKASNYWVDVVFQPET